MLDIRKLQKRYPNGFLALADFSLSVKQGEILAIVGGSGCGKSTLLRLKCQISFQGLHNFLELNRVQALSADPVLDVVDIDLHLAGL